MHLQLTASLLVLPIALHVPPYQDDFERAVNGMYYWSGDGRPLSEFIARLLALGAYAAAADRAACCAARWAPRRSTGPAGRRCP